MITSYPKGDRVPDAYYKLGLALNSQKQPDRAREAWEAVIKQFPNHEVAGARAAEHHPRVPGQAARPIAAADQFLKPNEANEER